MTQDNSFLPDDYEAPATGGGYMKLLQGENRIRILSSPILGWLGWRDKQPSRFRMDDKTYEHYKDIEEDETSECCGAPIALGLCTDCHEHI